MVQSLPHCVERRGVVIGLVDVVDHNLLIVTINKDPYQTIWLDVISIVSIVTSQSSHSVLKHLKVSSKHGVSHVCGPVGREDEFLDGWPGSGVVQHLVYTAHH